MTFSPFSKIIADLFIVFQPVSIHQRGTGLRQLLQARKLTSSLPEDRRLSIFASPLQEHRRR
jgi:hypothetical protein